MLLPELFVVLHKSFERLHAYFHSLPNAFPRLPAPSPFLSEFQLFYQVQAREWKLFARRTALDRERSFLTGHHSQIRYDLLGEIRVRRQKVHIETPLILVATQNAQLATRNLPIESVTHSNIHQRERVHHRCRAFPEPHTTYLLHKKQMLFINRPPS